MRRFLLIALVLPGIIGIAAESTVGDRIARATDDGGPSTPTSIAALLALLVVPIAARTLRAAGVGFPRAICARR